MLFASLWPNVMNSSGDPALALTIAEAASTNYTLTVMTVVAAVLTPIVLAVPGLDLLGLPRRVGLGGGDGGDRRRAAARNRPLMGPLHRRLLRTSRAARRHLAAAVALGVATAAAVIAQALLLAADHRGVFLDGESLADVGGAPRSRSPPWRSRAACSPGASSCPATSARPA